MAAAMFDTRKVIDVYLKPYNLCLSDFVVKKVEVIQEVLHIVKRIISNKCSTRLTEKSVEFGIRLREFLTLFDIYTRKVEYHLNETELYDRLSDFLNRYNLHLSDFALDNLDALESVLNSLENLLTRLDAFERRRQECEVEEHVERVIQLMSTFYHEKLSPITIKCKYSDISDDGDDDDDSTSCGELISEQSSDSEEEQDEVNRHCATGSVCAPDGHSSPTHQEIMSNIDQVTQEIIALNQESSVVSVNLPTQATTL